MTTLNDLNYCNHMTYNYRSRGNPFPQNPHDIHETLHNADSLISSESDNFMAIAELAISGLCRTSSFMHDALAIWEYYCDHSDMGALDKMPAFGAVARREYVTDHLVQFCDKWWTYAHTFLSYQDSFDWEFLPTFLGSLPTHDVERLSFEQIMTAMAEVYDSDSFRQHAKRAQEQSV